MSRTCSVCALAHASRLAIDVARRRGVSFRELSRRFRVSPAALHRHSLGTHLALVSLREFLEEDAAIRRGAAEEKAIQCEIERRARRIKMEANLNRRTVYKAEDLIPRAKSALVSARVRVGLDAALDLLVAEVRRAARLTKTELLARNTDPHNPAVRDAAELVLQVGLLLKYLVETDGYLTLGTPEQMQSGAV